MNELKNRGVEDLLVAVVDGLKGFPQAITAVFPQATVQTSCLRGARFALSKPTEKCEACPATTRNRGNVG
jgi:putative transposase